MTGTENAAGVDPVLARPPQARGVRMDGPSADAAFRTMSMLRKEGQSDAAACVIHALDGVRHPATMVIVGEVKRGKSTLVNALVGATVTPTGPEVVTNGMIWIVPPTATLPTGKAQLVYADGTRDTVAATDVLDLLDARKETTAPRATATFPIGAKVAAESRWRARQQEHAAKTILVGRLPAHDPTADLTPEERMPFTFE